jgi:hypothetical protein
MKGLLVLELYMRLAFVFSYAPINKNDGLKSAVPDGAVQVEPFQYSNDNRSVLYPASPFSGVAGRPAVSH